MSPISFRGADGCALYASSVGAGPPVVLMHGGGPDHRSLIPLARLLGDDHTVLLPDVRGYGRSICRDPAQHTWSRYGSDVVALLDHLGHPDAVVGGTGMGGTIAMRMCVDVPSRVRAAVLISVEDIEDDEAKAAEAALMDEFARRVRSDGVEAGWELFLPHCPAASWRPSASPRSCGPPTTSPPPSRRRSATFSPGSRGRGRCRRRRRPRAGRRSGCARCRRGCR